MVAAFSRQSTSKIQSLSQKTDLAWSLTSVFWTSLTQQTTVSPFLRMFFGLWITCVDTRFIHSYETVKKSHRIPPKWLMKQALDHASDSTGVSHLAESFLMSKISWIIQPTLSWDIIRVSALYFSGYSSIVQDHGMNGIHVFWNCHLSWSPGTFFILSVQTNCSKPSNPVINCGVGRALIT
jgi:hypothetical protein